MTFKQHPLWLIPNILSLDAPLIAVLWQSFFVAAFDVSLIPSGRIALGMAVWAVYLADRLLDTRGAKHPVLTARHRFHQEHRTSLAVLLSVVVVTGAAVAALYVRPIVLRDGAALAAAVLVYFFLVHGFIRVPKELLISLLFTCGTLLAPWTRTREPVLLSLGGVALFFACLANTVAIEDFEWARVRRQREIPLYPATRWLAKRYVPFFSVVLCCCLGVSLLAGSRELQPVLLAVGLSISLMLSLFVQRARFSPEAFRVLADVALLSPLPVWTIHQL